jgi:DNA-binding NarL/FixJ family response regulator
VGALRKVEEPVAEARSGEEEAPMSRGILAVGFDVSGQAWELTLEVRQLAGSDLRRNPCEVPRNPRVVVVSVGGRTDHEKGRGTSRGLARARQAFGAGGDLVVTGGEVVLVEPRGNENLESVENGAGRDPGADEPELVSPRSERDGAGTVAEAAGAREGREPVSWLNWQSVLYAFVLGVLCVFLVPLTSFWWIVPVLGVAAPVALVLMGGRQRSPTRLEDRKAKEGELLRALAERAELTPAAAAMRTSLTVEEASKMLEDLAGKGHLRRRASDDVVSYALAEQSRASLPEETGALARPVAEEDAVPGGAPVRPEEPLSERELEVLALLASGRTNAEIARDLFVALGTVKSHLNNIYRKLGAANRAEAVTRAREMRLLR